VGEGGAGGGEEKIGGCSRLVGENDMLADVLVTDSERRKVIVVATVMAHAESSPELAMERLPDILNGDETPPYVVMVTLDQTYFWRDPAHQRVPAAVIPTDVLLDRYLKELGKPAASVHDTTLIVIALSWLGDATDGAIQLPEVLDTIGFTDAVRDGRVDLPSAA
jgi:hypothetical protein